MKIHAIKRQQAVDDKKMLHYLFTYYFNASETQSKLSVEDILKFSTHPLQ